MFTHMASSRSTLPAHQEYDRTDGPFMHHLRQTRCVGTQISHEDEFTAITVAYIAVLQRVIDHPRDTLQHRLEIQDVPVNLREPETVPEVNLERELDVLLASRSILLDSMRIVINRPEDTMMRVGTFQYKCSMPY